MSSMTINGRPYDLDEVLMSAGLNHLLFLKQKANLGMRSMVTALQSLEATAKSFPEVPEDQDAEGDSDEVLAAKAERRGELGRRRGEAFLGAFEDEGVLNAFRGIVWLARARAGDRDEAGQYLTIDAASEGVSITSLIGGDDDDAEVPDENPKGDAAEPVVTPS